MSIFAAAPDVRSAGESRLWRDELVATLALAWPLVLANLAQVGMATTDVILVGRLGGESLASVALAANLYHAVLLFGIGVVTAVAALLAETFGRRRHAVREARRTVRQGFWAALTLAVPLTALLWNGERVLLLIGQEPKLAHAAGTYLHAMQWSLFPALAFTVLRQFIAALERPGWALAIGLAALPLNALLAWTLIFGHFGLPALGLFGAGLATSTVNLAMATTMIVVVLRDRQFRRYHLFGRFWRPDWPRLRSIWRIGLPIGAIIAFEITAFNAAAFLQGIIGATSLAAHAVAIQIAATSFMVPLGIGQAVTIRVGLAYGAGDRPGIARAGWTAFGIVIAFMSFTALLMLAMPDRLVGLFLDEAVPGSAEVARLAVSFLLFAALFQVADGAQAALAGMLRGMQDTRVPMLLAGFGYWIVGGSLCVGLGFGTPLAGRGIWIGLAVALGVVSALLLHRWLNRERLGLTTRV